MTRQTSRISRDHRNVVGGPAAARNASMSGKGRSKTEREGRDSFPYVNPRAASGLPADSRLAALPDAPTGFAGRFAVVAMRPQSGVLVVEANGFLA